MKAILVIDIADDVAEAYGDITVDYDLRGRPKEDGFYTESIKYVEDCPLRPLPTDMIGAYANSFAEDYVSFTEGWDSYKKALMGETE